MRRSLNGGTFYQEARLILETLKLHHPSSVAVQAMTRSNPPSMELICLEYCLAGMIHWQLLAPHVGYSYIGSLRTP